jgi:hypothetical protein
MHPVEGCIGDAPYLVVFSNSGHHSAVACGSGLTNQCWRPHSLIRDGRSAYANADPYVKRLSNRTLIERIEIKGGLVAGVALKQAFAGHFLLASSNKPWPAFNLRG